MKNLDSFTRQYIATALWSSTDDGGTPLDYNYSPDDLHPSALAKMIADCAKFQADNAQLLSDAYAADLPSRPRDNDAQGSAGHDFWLTRNSHGAGFWDGDWSTFGDALTTASEAFGESNLYVGDDGKIHTY
jgi:hypothetical protein